MTVRGRSLLQGVRIPGLRRLRLGARWLRSRWVGHALILGYHRVADEPSDPFGLCVSPRRFAEQLEVIGRHANPVSLPELTRALDEGGPPRRAVAVTFDDGYADLLHHATPLLERYEVPATVFLVAGRLGRELWWDALERVLREAATRVQKGQSRTRDGRARADELRARLEELGLPLHEETFASGPVAANAPALLWDLHRHLRVLSETGRREALETLSEWAGSRAEDPGARCTLAPDEVVRLAEGSRIEIGAHSMTHPALSALSVEEQRTEIMQSRHRLEELLGRPVTSFSYPHGCSSAVTESLVREAGFARACGSANDVAWRGSDLFHLPRFWVPDWDGNRFARWLERWLGAFRWRPE